MSPVPEPTRGPAPVRVALLPSSYPPRIGGVEELTRRLARALVEAGDAVEVWTPSLDGHRDDDEIDGIPVRRLPMPLPPARPGPVARFPLDGARALRGLLGAADRFRPDLLHVQCFSVNGAWATALGALRRLPLVVSLQGETVMDDHDIFEHSASLRAALRLAARRAAALTACSAFVLDDAARFGVAGGRGQVIFNGVDPAPPVDGPPPAVPFDRYVLGLGRMVPKKGFDLLLDAFPAVAARLPGTGLVLAGGGPQRSALERRAQAPDLAGRVHFTGPLTPGQVAAAMAGAAVFVMPSRVEPFGIVVLEAWRAGCPVVASSVGGAPEFVRHGADGLLVDPADPAALAGAVSRVAGDAGLARTLADGGSARVGDFAWAEVAGRYRRVYARALAGGPVGPAGPTLLRALAGWRPGQAGRQTSATAEGWSRGAIMRSTPTARWASRGDRPVTRATPGSTT